MPNGTLAITGGIELAKLLLQAYFQLAALTGLTEEQSGAMYESEKVRFNANRPEYLKDV